MKRRSAELVDRVNPNSRYTCLICGVDIWGGASHECDPKRLANIERGRAASVDRERDDYRTIGGRFDEGFAMLDDDEDLSDQDDE